MKMTKRGSKGFTLLEILIVLVILAVVAGLAVPAYISAVEKSRKSEAIATLGAVRASAQRYFAQAGSYTGMNYTNMDFNPTTAVTGNTPHFTYGAPAAAAATYTVVATRNATNFSATSGCAAGYTVTINQLGVITATC